MKWELCNHAFEKLIRAGKAIAFSLDALQRSGNVSGLHGSVSEHVHKSDPVV